MASFKVFPGLAVVLVTAVKICLAPAPGHPPARGALVSPFLKIGPQAVASGVMGPHYGLFTCQLLGFSPSATCYDPFQIRHAYNIDNLINAGYDGRGKTIVIIDAYQSPNIVQELNFFDAFYGLPSLNGLGGPVNSSLGTFTQVAPQGPTQFVAGDANMTMWAEEISLDVLWAHAIAPGANIVLVMAKSDLDADMFSATKYAVDNSLGDIISQSFGENESCMSPSLLAQQQQMFEEATAKNITLFASTGDDGSAQLNCDGFAFVKAASNPAVDPLVTAVGGTELHAAPYCLGDFGCNLNANPVRGTYENEVVWNEAGIGAGGGGFSLGYGEPSYQLATIRGGKQRGEPDVSYNAAVYHGVLTYLNIPGLSAGFYLFGGTSAGSPQWAALLAIAGQKAGHNLGYINKALYMIGQAQSPYSVSFNDITSGNNGDFGVPGFSAGPGWDAASGLGSPKAGELVGFLIEFVAPGDGTAAITQLISHPSGNSTTPGQMNPH